MAPTSFVKRRLKKRDDSDIDSSSDSDSDLELSDNETTVITTSAPSSDKKPYRQRVLILSTRGIDGRHRHLMKDIATLLPHSKTDAKMDTKHQLGLINELCDLNNCNNALFFEARRRFGDTFLWASAAPNGPSVRFHMLNTHTMDEMNMSGNCLKGSRPLVVFDSAFDESAHMKLIKGILSNIFAVPKTSRRTKPFIDHVISFSVLDGRIWFRNYQITDTDNVLAEGGRRMTEIGPRFVLVPVKIFEGSFNGSVLYSNESFTPSAEVAAAQRSEKAERFAHRAQSRANQRERMAHVHSTKGKDKLAKSAVFA